MKNLIIAISMSLITGIGIGWFAHKVPAPVNSNTTTTQTIKTSDTTISKKELAVIQAAKTQYVAVTVSGPSSKPGKDPISIQPANTVVIPNEDGIPDNIEKISYCDTVDANGFEAHIQYLHKADQFRNRFILPERTITNNEVTTTSSTSNKVTIVYEVPRWELGIGARARLIDSKVNYTWYPLLAYNTKIWFVYLTVEGQGGVLFKDGGISMVPADGSKIKGGVVMADDVVPEVTFRINSDRDTSMCIRKDMILDLVDMLKDITKANGYNQDVKANTVWRLDDFTTNELPGNMVFASESTEISRPGSLDHTMTVTFAHIDSDGKKTGLTLLDGAQDILTVLGKIREDGQNFARRFCKKYPLSQPPEFISTETGLEAKRKTEGEIDVVIEIKYVSGLWTL